MLLQHLLSAQTPAAASYNILMVVSDTVSVPARDVDIQTLLEGAGHTVTLIADNDVISSSADGYDIAYLSSSISLAPAESIFVASSTPVFCGSIDSANGHNLVTGTANTGFITQIDVEVNNDPSGVLAGVALGNLTILSSNTGLATSSTLGDGRALASEPGTAANKVLVLWNAADNLGVSGTAPAKRAMFLGGAGADRLLAAGETIVLQIFNWLGT